MKSSVDQLNDTRVKVTVEVPFSELGPELDKAYQALAQQINIPGFRRGKAPRQLIDARVGRGPVLEQVVNDMLPTRYGQAIEELDIKALGQPNIDITKLEDGDVIEFVAEVDVRPEFDLPDFSEISVEVPALGSTEERIDHELEHLRERFGSLKTVDREAGDEDFITLNLSATVDGEEIEDAKVEDMSYRVGSGDLIEGLDDAVKGLKADESATFTSKLVFGEYADKDAEVTVTVTAVKERELPELDDDFAQMASEFDTVEELRADLASGAEESAKAEQAARHSSRCPRPWLTSRSTPRCSSSWASSVAMKPCLRSCLRLKAPAVRSSTSRPVPAPKRLCARSCSWTCLRRRKSLR